MTPLARLHAAVEAGPLWADDDLAISKRAYKMISAAFPNDENGENFCAAYGDGDVSAAISLCNAMLPGYKIALMQMLMRDGDWEWTARVWVPSGCNIISTAINPAPARALLIAMLRALVDAEGKP